MPLLLADRNFDVGPDGRLTGELLHKTDPEVMECFSPFTTVKRNDLAGGRGGPTTYRFRLLNEKRTPAPTDSCSPATASPTTGGSPRSAPTAACCSRPMSLPAQGLVLASAERADLLVDFSDLSPGVGLTIGGTRPAPFDGTFADPTIAGTGSQGSVAVPGGSADPYSSRPTSAPSSALWCWRPTSGR